MSQDERLWVYRGEALGRYSFGRSHPFGPGRQEVLWSTLVEQGLSREVELLPPVSATRELAELFHTPRYLDLVAARSVTGGGFLDGGDTPAFCGVWEAALVVVGTVADAVSRILGGELRRAFVPVAGLHHARRDRAGGFCVLNDCGVAIEVLRQHHGLTRIAYVDIDAHHGDGVYYGFERHPEVVIADIHEDGRFLYPGTGFAHEQGRGEAAGTKLNIPLPPGAGDAEHRAAWERVESFVDAAAPQMILLQCGADALAGDPLAHLELTVDAYTHAAGRLCRLAERHCDGRLLALGGGGYAAANLAAAWLAVAREMIGVR
jgi:acetoin utilization protein AcuC